MPPRWVRRLLLPAATIAVAVTVLTALPLLVVAAAAASPVLPGRWRPLRLLCFAMVLLAAEAVALVALLGLWLASGLGWRMRASWCQDAHHALMRWYLRALVATARWTFNLRIDVDETDRAVVRAAYRGDPAPVVVLSRHAGAGDSLLLAHALVANRLRPRVVLKDALQWAPALDVLLHRIPAVFIAPPGRRRTDPLDDIARLADTMEAGDALLLFPEGGNFTAGRRRRSIAKLERLGRHAEAEQARQMRHVLAPRPGGASAAFSGAPDADVLFVAHTGLEELSSVVDVWQGLPMDADVRATVWHVPAEHIPDDADERTAWLYRWWRRIDAWIVEHHGPAAAPDAVVAAVADPDPPS